MNEQLLSTNAGYLVAQGRGVLAADESSASCQKRFDAVGVECTPDTRRDYREILLTTPEAVGVLSGVIFYDETFWQSTRGGETFLSYCEKSGILPGIKVDEGLTDLSGFPGEKVTRGLDTLPERMKKYQDAGAKFAKWRAVIAIDKATGIPTDSLIGANAYTLARYARICQDHNIVPMVEPEVLFDGTHTIEECEAVMVRVYTMLFAFMKEFRVYLPGAILKTSMVLPGKESGLPVIPEEVAERTARVMKSHIPSDLGGVVFLSGGQTPTQAFLNLNAIAKAGPYPWGVTFSYSRALQDPVLKYWAEHRDDTKGGMDIFARQLSVAVRARDGKLEGGELGGDFVSSSQDL
jgi:fructose-bisphosphate aldolase, class I